MYLFYLFNDNTCYLYCCCESHLHIFFLSQAHVVLILYIPPSLQNMKICVFISMSVLFHNNYWYINHNRSVSP